MADGQATNSFDGEARRSLSVLPPVLREPRRAWLAIPLAAAISLAGSLALAFVVTSFLPALEQPVFDMTGWAVLIAIILIAPLLETLIMAAVLEILLRLARPSIAIGLSAAGWGLAHSSAAPAWGLVIWWPFLIFSTMYVIWRRRSIPIAILVVTAIHMLQNLAPALHLMMGGE